MPLVWRLNEGRPPLLRLLLRLRNRHSPPRSAPQRPP
jgi:hypothetical protein